MKGCTSRATEEVLKKCKLSRSPVLRVAYMYLVTTHAVAPTADRSLVWPG